MREKYFTPTSIFVLHIWLHSIKRIEIMTNTNALSHRKKIPFLNVADYEHPWDQAARSALEQVPGFTAIITKLNQIGFDRLLRIQFTGSNLKVNPRSLPVLAAGLHQMCDVLSIERHPELYLQLGFEVNAFTAGVETPVLVLNSGCVDLLTPSELAFVLAHELGHIKSQHVLYYQTASFLPAIAQIAGNATLGIGGLLTGGVQLALQHWSRMSELTADRAGLLGCQDPEAAVSALVKMAGLPQTYHNSNLVQDFIQQAKEFEAYDYDALDKIAKVLGVMNQSHPWTVMRAAELFKWIDSGEYNRVLNQQSWKTAPVQIIQKDTISSWRFG